MLHDLVIHERDAARIQTVLAAFMGESGASESLLIDRGGQLLASGGEAPSFDTVSLSALAAGAFSSTGAIAGLLGESEFSVLFHQGVRRSIHVSTVDAETILLAIFDDGTTVGMVRLFAREACRAIEAILAECRAQPRRVPTLKRPLSGEVPTIAAKEEEL
jgi:predicted regulator of Ras-like GTPase activity (Roadblock/LC7/MglB family)